MNFLTDEQLFELVAKQVAAQVRSQTHDAFVQMQVEIMKLRDELRHTQSVLAEVRDRAGVGISAEKFARINTEAQMRREYEEARQRYRMEQEAKQIDRIKRGYPF